MKSPLFTLTIGGLLIILMVLFTLPQAPAKALSAKHATAANGQVYYVSPTGNDAWTGTLAEPNGAASDGPFATLGRARDAIRARHAHGARPQPVTVYLRAGTYRLRSPLVFLPEDSGTAECPITYAAFAGEKPVLSGGRVITGWRKDAASAPDAGPERWTADVPGVKEGEWYFHQLFVDGQRRQRARSPNSGVYHADGRFVVTSPTHFKFNPGEIHPAWVAQGDVEIVGLERWSEFRAPLIGVDVSTSTATLPNARSRWGDEEDARYWVENAADALDAPGEWFLDRRSGVLAYLALPGEDVAHAEFVAPQPTQLIRMEGRWQTGEFVHDISLRGLTFAHADWSLPAKGYVDRQADYDIPGTVELIAARRCRIEQCTFVHLGQYAVEVHQGSQDDAVTACEMTDVGAGGVKIGDPHLPADAQVTTRIRVAQNYIHNLGIVFPAAVGVWIGESGGNTVAHNEISDLYYTAISLGWTWGYGPSAAHDNIIEFNHLHDIGRGLLSDMGCIYSLGKQTGTIERYNLCHDVTRYKYGGWGIYTDEGSSQMLIENNVVYNTEDGGFHQHYGRENIIRNNIFAWGEKAQLKRSVHEPHSSFTFEHNIVYWKQGKFLDSLWNDNDFTMDFNLYYQASGEPFQFGKESLEEWRKRGHDVHSLIADPLFVDPEHGDFTLKPGSPAFAIGFQPIDASSIGRTVQ